MKDLTIGDERLAALEKKASEDKDSFVVVAKTLEDREATLCAKEAQLFDALDCLWTLEGQAATETRELRLVSVDLRQSLDAQEEKG